MEIPLDSVEIESPRNRNDFELIKSRIHNWKENKVRLTKYDSNWIWTYKLGYIYNLQIQFIKENIVDKNQQQDEFHKLLKEEIRLLNELDKKRNKIRKKAQEIHMDKMLDRMGAPVKWIGYKSEWK